MQRKEAAAALVAWFLAASCGSGGDEIAADAGAGSDAPGGTVTKLLGRPSKSSTIAISEDDAIVVMVNPDDDSISVFATVDNHLIARVPVGNEPSSVVLAPDGRTAFVALRADAQVKKVTGLDSATPIVSMAVATGSEPTGLALSPTGATLFVAEFAEGSILIVDTASMTQKGEPLKGAIKHPRAIAVTNDGDDDDGDELLIVPEFFGEPNEFAMDASTLDRSRTGRVRIYDLSQSPPKASHAIQLDAHDSGIVPGGAAGTVFASPNQLWNVFIRRDATDPGDVSKARIYIPAVAVAPQAPTRFDGNVYPVIYVGSLGSRNEVTGTSGTINLAQRLLASDGPAPGDDKGKVDGKLFLADLVDLSFVPSTAPGGAPTDGATAYAVARGADAVERVTFGDTVSIGGSVNLQIDVVGGGGVHDGCKGPTGIVVNNAGDKAFVNCWVSQNLGVVALGNEQKLVAAKQAFPPDPGSAGIDRGRRFYFTGRGRWSGNGTLAAAPTVNDSAWSSCGSCHPDGLTDNMTWIFNAGPRQTTSMDGTFSKGPGMQKQRVLNWTGIFEEIHDFERNTRDTSGGLGALTTAATPTDCGNLAAETRQGMGAADGLQQPAKERQLTSGNCRKDWDDIEAWVKTIRPPMGLKRLDPAKVALGAQLFRPGTGVNNGACANCHGGAGWTLSRVFFTPASETNGSLAAAPFAPGAPWPAAWNKQSKQIEIEQVAGVGPLHVSCVIRNLSTAEAPANTFGPAALEKKNPDGQATAQGVNGYNIPSLYGLSLGAPYLHAGQAASLPELLDGFAGHLKAGNDNFAATAEQKDALVQFLLSIDASTPEIAAAEGFDKCLLP